MEEEITKTFTITTSPRIMGRIERFFALLHFNGRFGHSGTFGMGLDGDGADHVTVNPMDKKLSPEVNLLGGVGYDVEIARDDSYSGRFTDRNKPPRYEVKPKMRAAVLCQEHAEKFGITENTENYMSERDIECDEMPCSVDCPLTTGDDQ